MKHDAQRSDGRGRWRRPLSVVASLVGAVSLAATGLTLASASAASAATTASAAPCAITVSAGSGTAVGPLIVGVTAGATTINFDCNTTSNAAFGVEASMLSLVGASSVSQQASADISALAQFKAAPTDTNCPAGTAGTCETATFTIPASFSAADPNAQCPPTQAQINEGLYGCVLAVATAAGIPVPGSSVLITYANSPMPSAPTVLATPSVAVAGSSVSLRDASATGDWWGNAIQTNQAVATGTTPMAPPATCSTGYGSVPAPLVMVNWFASGSTTPILGSATGLTITNDCYDGTTLHGPTIGGSIMVPSTLSAGTAYTAYVCELNITPYPSNDANSAAHCGPAPQGASWIDASFPFTAAKAAITQSAPQAVTITANKSASFSAQLAVTGNSGTTTFTQATGSPQLVVSSSGAVSTSGALKPGTYQATGTVSDANGDGGPFTFALTVKKAPPVIVTRVTRVVGAAVRGRFVILTIFGTGFLGRPRISPPYGTVVRIVAARATMLKLRMLVRVGGPHGYRVMILRFNDGRVLRVRYLFRG